MSHILSWVPNWHIIKAIGGSRAVALAGFFPFVGYLVVANVTFTEFIILVTDQVGGKVNLDLVYDRLTSIYIGMLSLAAGVIVYKLFCPHSISMFNDHYQFLEKELAIATPLRVASLQEEMRDLSRLQLHFFDAQLKSQIEETKDLKLDDASITDLGYSGQMGSGIKSLKAYQSDEGIPLTQLLFAYYGMKDSSLGPIRLVAITAFGFGYFKLGSPAIIVAWQIIRES